MVAASHLLQLDTLQAAVVSRGVVSSAVVSRTVVSRTVVSRAVVSSAVVSSAVVSRAVVSSAVVSRAMVSSAIVSSAIVSSAMVSSARHVLQAAGLRCHPFGKRCARSFIHPADSIHVDEADKAGEAVSSSARGEGEAGVDCAAAHMEASRVADCTSSRA